MIFLYKLSNDEEKILARWAKDKRWEYFKQHKYMFLEESIEDKTLYSNNNVESEVIGKVDAELDPNNSLKHIFETNKKMAKAVETLSYEEETIIKSLVIHRKKDKVLAEELKTTIRSIQNKRSRAYKKIRKGNGKDDE